MKKAWSLAAIALAICGSAATSAPAGEFPDNWYYPGAARVRGLEGKPAPALELGQWYTPQVDWAGKVLVVDFWGTWCGPCRNAIPHNNEIVARYADKGVVVLGVHDSSRGVDKIAQIVREKQIAYPVAVDRDGLSAKAWKVPFWPTYAVVDTDGIVRAIGLAPASVDKVLDRVLGREPPPPTPPTPPPPPSAGAEPESRWLEGDADARNRLTALLERPAPPPLRADAWVVGDAAQLDKLAGSVVLLSFWTPGDAECLRALRELADLHAKHAGEGLVIVAMASATDPQEVCGVAEGFNLPYRVAIDQLRSTARGYRINGYPDSFLIDRAGKLRYADVREDALPEAIAALLAEKAPAREKEKE